MIQQIFITKSIIGKTIFVVIGICIVACTQKTRDIPLDTDKKKISYAIGYQVGQSFKAQGIQVDIDVIAMSIQDVFSDDNKRRMTDEDMLKAVQNMRKTAIEHQKKQTDLNKQKSQDFLEKNKSVEGVLSTSSGLQYQIQKTGDGPKPNKQSTVRVHYKGTLITGEEFDSSYKRGHPAEFPVSGVIPGWTEALQMMPVGSKWKLFIPSDLAYGPQSRPKIPGHSALIFEVELLDIVQQNQDAPKTNSKKNE